MSNNTTNIMLVLVAIVLIVMMSDARKEADKAQVRGEEYWANSWHRYGMIALAEEFETKATGEENGRLERCKLIVKKLDQLLAEIENDLREKGRVVIVKPEWIYYYEGEELIGVETPDPVIYIYER